MTGVGPDIQRMVRWRAVAAVPAIQAGPVDYQKRYPSKVVGYARVIAHQEDRLVLLCKDHCALKPFCTSHFFYGTTLILLLSTLADVCQDTLQASHGGSHALLRTGLDQPRSTCQQQQ